MPRISVVPLNPPRTVATATLRLLLRRNSPSRRKVLPSVVMLCPARNSPLRSVPSLPQRLSAFRSCLPPAYRLCFASQSSAESPEPSSKEFLRHSLLPVSAAFTAPNRFASTTMLTSCRRPDAPVRMLWRLCFYSWFSASGGVTLISRSNLIPSATCRAVPACLLTSYETLSAALPETRKMSSPPTLTHALALCRISPASHARPGQQGYKHIPGWRLRRRCHQRYCVPCMLVDTSQLKTSSIFPTP